MSNKIGIFIPCYNVQKTIRDVLLNFSPATLDKVDQVVVIDNMSKDNTFDMLRDIQFNTAALRQKMVILKNRQNYGLGGSQKIAYQYFIDQKFTHFMIIHSDNQGNGEEIANFLLDVLKQKPDIDVVLASRFHPQANTAEYSGLRRVGNHFFNFMTFLLTGHRMSDAGTGIMLIRTDVLKNIPFAGLTDSFQFNPQLNILLYNIKGLKTAEVPLNWRDSKAGSNIQAMEYCITLLKILGRYRINKTFLRKKGAELFGSPKVSGPFNYDVYKADAQKIMS